MLRADFHIAIFRHGGLLLMPMAAKFAAHAEPVGPLMGLISRKFPLWPVQPAGVIGGALTVGSAGNYDGR